MDNSCTFQSNDSLMDIKVSEGIECFNSDTSYNFTTIDNNKKVIPRNKKYLKRTPEKEYLLDDDLDELDIVDTRKYMSAGNNQLGKIILEDIPTKISGTYNEDYNIMYVDEIIKKKLKQEKFTCLHDLKSRYRTLDTLSLQPQTYVMREKTLESMKKLQQEIKDIESGEKLRRYEERVKDILIAYRKYTGQVKTVIFDDDDDEKYQELDDDVRYRIFLIDTYLDIAADYIQIDIIRINNRPSDVCTGCGHSLVKVAITDEGTIRCPNLECQIEHNVIILAKLAKDGARINTNNSTDDESIDNFLRAFIRYQGLQPDQPDRSIYDELDAYFIRNGRPTGDEIKKLPLNERGRRGDTDHKMLWDALSQIGHSGLYEDANLIGHEYWGWQLHNVMHLKERIIEKYNKTQKVFFQIPLEERCRSSSLGTQFRLWRHLQLEGHECYIDEFKIAENPESLRNHNRLWRMMCEGANDPDIYYIN